MKQLLTLIAAVMLLSITACAKQQTKQGATQMQLTPDYGNKPSYRLHIEGFGDYIQVFFNGNRVFKDYSRSQVITVYPINDYVTTGENALKVRFFESKAHNFRLNPKGWFKVYLEISDAAGSWQRLGGIVYDAAAKAPLKNSAHEGYYTLEAGKGFKPVALPSEAEVSKVKMEKQTILNTKKVNALNFTQTLTFPTPFPRWKFLDSEDIVGEEYFSYSLEEYEKLRQSPKMQKLYDAYEEILSLISHGKYEKAVDHFDERIGEYAYAWRDTKDALKQSLINKFRTLSNDPNYELVPLDRTKKYFFIEENRKLAYIPSAIKFKKKGVAFQRIFNAKFRWDGNRWILTR